MPGDKVTEEVNDRLVRDRLRQMGVEVDDTARSLSEEGPHHICRRGDGARLHLPALGAGLLRGGGGGEGSSAQRLPLRGAALPSPAPCPQPPGPLPPGPWLLIPSPLAPWPLAPGPWPLAPGGCNCCTPESRQARPLPPRPLPPQACCCRAASPGTPQARGWRRCRCRCRWAPLAPVAQGIHRGERCAQRAGSLRGLLSRR